MAGKRSWETCEGHRGGGSGAPRRGPRNRHRGRFRGPRPLWIALPLAAHRTTSAQEGRRAVVARGKQGGDPRRLGHPGSRRRGPARRPDRRPGCVDRHLLLGGLAVGTRAPRQHAGVPHRPLRRRRAAPPRRPRAAPARVGRLRPVPQGARRHRPLVGRARRQAAERRTRPVGVPPVLGRALQGAPARRPARDGRRHGGDLPDRALPQRVLPRRGAPRRPPPRRDRDGARSLPDQEGGSRGCFRPGGRGPGRLGGRRRRQCC